MAPVLIRRAALCAVLALAGTPLLGGPGESQNRDYKGKVVPLAAVLEKQKIKLDADAAPHWLALQADDGKIYPLVKDDGSRMFFKDERLLNRPMQLTGRVLPEVGMFQVVDVHSYLNGQLHEVYYWCDICSIRRSQKGICDCCN